MLFVAADHLNDVDGCNMEPIDMARLNLLVGEKAAKVSAFIPASNYLYHGVAALSSMQSPWEDHYDLSLRTWQAATDIEFCLGNFEKGTEYCEATINNATSDTDRLQAYYSLANSYGKQHRYIEAVDIHSKALAEVGELPKRLRLIYAVYKFSRLAKIFKKWSDYDILLLPRMRDARLNAVMDHLERMTYRGFLCNNFPVVLLCLNRSITLTLKHGISFRGASAVASYSIILFGAMKNQKLGSRMSKLALDIRQALGNAVTSREKELSCSLIFIVHAYVYSFSRPLSGVLEALEAGSREGYESGNLEACYQAIAGTYVIGYNGGFSLHSIRETSESIHRQMKIYKVNSIGILNEEVRFVLDHLMDMANAPPDWDSFGTLPLVEGDEQASTFKRIWYCWAHLQVAYYFRRYDVANKLGDMFKQYANIDSSFATCTLRVFFSGLAAFAMATETRKREYLQKAKKLTREMKEMTRKKGLNNVHRLYILEACLMSYDKKKKQHVVMHAFVRAIAAAESSGFRQDAALGNELAAEYLLQQHNDGNAARPYFSAAYHLYQEWGANGLVTHLRQIRGEYIIEEDVFRSSAFTSNNSRQVVTSTTGSGGIVGVSTLTRSTGGRNSSPSGIGYFPPPHSNKPLLPTEMPTVNAEDGQSVSMVSSLSLPSGASRTVGGSTQE